MPTLYATAKWKITMYFRDHQPPHFRIMTRDRQEARIRIADLAVVAGKVPRSVLDGALQWAEANRAILAAKWKEMHP